MDKRNSKGQFEKGNIPWMSGKHFNEICSNPEERKKKISKTMKDKFKKSIIKPTWLGKKLSEKHRQNIIKSLKGKMPKNIELIKGWNKGLKWSDETIEKISKNNGRYWLNKKRPNLFSKEVRERMSKSRMGQNSGEKNWRWKGGITPINVKIRNSIEGILWRKSVFERDNFTCQKYGIVGGKLCAHHINNFADFLELRFAIDNGITLSLKAHKEFHKMFGIKNNTKEQLIIFLNKKL